MRTSILASPVVRAGALVTLAAGAGLAIVLANGWQPGVGGLAVVLLACVVPIAIIPGLPSYTYFVLFPLLVQVNVGGSGTESALLVLVAASALLGTALVTQPHLARINALDVAILALGVACLVSIGASYDGDKGKELEIYALDIAIYGGIRLTTGSRKTLRLALWAMAIGGTAAALSAELRIGAATGGESIRLGVPGIGVNDFAAIIVSALGATVGLTTTTRSTVQRLALIGMGMVQLLEIVLSQSRGGFIALGALLVVGILLTGRRHSGRAVLLIVIGGGLLWGFVVIPQIGQSIGLGDAQARISTLLSGNDLADTQRVQLWRMSVQAFADNPLTGVGVGNFTNPDVAYNLARQAGVPLAPFTGPSDEHSLYLAYLAELGIVGGLLLGSCIAMVAWKAIRLVREWHAHGGGLEEVAPVILAMTGFFAAAAFLPLQASSLAFALPALLQAIRVRPAERASVAHAAQTGEPVLTVGAGRLRTARSKARTTQWSGR